MKWLILPILALTFPVQAQLSAGNALLTPQHPFSHMQLRGVSPAPAFLIAPHSQATGGTAQAMNLSTPILGSTSTLLSVQTLDTDGTTFFSSKQLLHITDLGSLSQTLGIVSARNRIYLDHGGYQADALPGTSTMIQNDLAANAIYVQSNSEVQIGGITGVYATNYGQGDVVGRTTYLTCTGNPSAYGEGCEGDREFVQIHGDNWGFVIASITQNPTTGETSILGTVDANGFGLPADGHDLKAQNENALAIDITQTYTAGNVQSISTVPANTLPSGATGHYIYIVGDSHSGWDTHFGPDQSKMTFTRAPVPVSAGPKIAGNNFANGALLINLQVDDASVCTSGQQATISDDLNSFEMPIIQSVDLKMSTFAVYLSKPHATGSLVACGGGVGNAINMTADTWQPKAWPTFDMTNLAQYRLAFPIIATLPGNKILVDTFGFNQGTEYGTRALQSTQIVQLPTPGVLQMSGGIFYGFPHWNPGIPTYKLPTGTSRNGGIIAVPTPAIVFSGGNCTTQPQAHIQPNQNAEWWPVVDTPGAGCDNTLTATVQSTITSNPYDIHPAAWIRSNVNPNYPANCAGKSVQDATCGNRNPELMADPAQVMTASTSGFVLVDSAPAPTPLVPARFAVGDTIEGVYQMHQGATSAKAFIRTQYDTGISGGGVERNSFYGLDNGIAFQQDVNLSPYRDYYGLGTNNNVQDAGEVASGAPTWRAIDGPVGNILTMTSPPRLNSSFIGTILFVNCGSVITDAIKNAPCMQPKGLDDEYEIWSNQNQHRPDQGVQQIHFSAQKHSLVFEDHYGSGSAPDGLLNINANLGQQYPGTAVVTTLKATSLAGPGNAYACLDTNGNLYRSTTPCTN